VQIADDSGFTELRAASGDTETFILYFGTTIPPMVTAFTRIQQSMWLSMLREAMSNGLTVTITHPTDSAVVNIVRLEYSYRPPREKPPVIISISIIEIQGANADVASDVANADEIYSRECGVFVSVVSRTVVNRPDLLVLSQTDCAIVGHVVSTEEDALFDLGRGVGTDLVGYYISGDVAGFAGLRRIRQASRILGWRRRFPLDVRPRVGARRGR
jgi:hypothetical protein